MASTPHHRAKRERSRSISVRVRPTIGTPFDVSVSPSARISNLKDAISDRMGISTQKMTLLRNSSVLATGTLSDNSITDGCEVQLVPAVETGVATTNSLDPVAMMKHSMSVISDQQIEDFLNGKHPLSVAIRMGESVVVVNLHRAKVEEDGDPPQPKRRCLRAHRLSQDSGYCGSIPSSSPSPSPSPSPAPSPLSCSTPPATDFHLNSNPRLSTPRPPVDSPYKPPSPPNQPLSSGGSHRESSDEPCCSYSQSQTLCPPSQPLTRSEPRLGENGVTMKRKAVMEAISEILKKMYASSEKGRLPGSFKGRFSSEFTCDSDMNDIVHTKTTMTGDGGMGKGSSTSLSGHQHDVSIVSRSQFKENEQLKGKMALIKYRMQQQRAVKAAKRRVKGEKSPCGWMERLNCDMPSEPPQNSPLRGYCGLKKGFLLS